MRRILLIISVLMIGVGIVANFIGNSMSYVDASGMVHDSILLPISALLIVFGILSLILSGILFMVAFIRNKKSS